jgi:ribosomal protein L16 Arg81 hydroxylase
MATATTVFRLDKLLAPLGLFDFIDHYMGKRPLLLRGRREQGRELISLEGIVAAFSARGAATGRLLVADANLRGATEVWRYIDSGQAIVWNGARGATPEIDALTDELAATFGGSAWANVYSTGAGAKPFDVHFDCHDVLAVQVEGAKEWFVSKVRVNCPLDVPALAPTIRRALTERRDEALAEPLMTVVTEPGDLLYIPRGQFHDARTPAGRSLHVTFAIAPPTGLDVIEALARLALGEAQFRDYLPHPLATGRSLADHVAALGDRLAALARSPDLQAGLERTLGADLQEG